MTTESLQRYLDNIEKRTGAKFEILVAPEVRYTNNGYDGDNPRYFDHAYTCAQIRLVNTKFTMAVVWSGDRWKRGRG